MDGRLRLNFVKDDGEVVKLPPGFRFQPTEEEIVFQYLQRKTFSLPLPASVIPELPNICTFDPWDLPGDIEQEDRYFFSNKEATNRVIMSSNGYWKPITSSAEEHIACPNNKIMGLKKTLVFYYGNPPHGSKTDWIMHEYRLVTATNPPPPAYFRRSFKKDHPQGSTLMQHIGNVVLCHVFQKKRVIGKTEERDSAEVCGDNYNFMIRDGWSDDDDGDGDSCYSSSKSSRVINDDNEVSSSHFSRTLGYEHNQDANYI